MYIKVRLVGGADLSTCVCVHVCVHVCARVCVCVCVCICVHDKISISLGLCKCSGFT